MASYTHAALANSREDLIGGCVAYGCFMRTAAEVLLALLGDWSLAWKPGSMAGHVELAVRR